MTNVLHLVNYGWPSIDGYTVRTAGLVTAQQRHLGYNVHVAVGPHPPFTASRDEQFTTEAWGPDQTTVGTTRTWERPGLGLAPITASSMATDLDRLVDSFGPDIIHVHHPHYLFGPAASVAKRRGIPLVYEVRCFNGDYDLDRRHPWFRHVRGPLFNRLELAACRRADAVVTISDGLADRITAAGAGPVHVVRNSVPTDLFASAPGASDASGATHDRDPSTARAGYATTFEPIESLDVLVEALVKARDMLSTAITLSAVIAGGGREFDKIVALRDRLGARDWLELPGFVPYHRMPEFMAELDVFVVPRGHATVVQHTTPLKPLEALASGTPVVSTNLPALRELLEQHPDVRFADPSPGDLARAIVESVKAGGRADPNAVDRSWRSEVEIYRNVYETAAAAARASAASLAGANPKGAS